MKEADAAAYLNLTPRTLRNYRNQGKLPYREVKGKTRPQIEYRQDDLDRLKAELQKQRQRSLKPKATTPALPRVTFGLPLAELADLTAEAKKYRMTPADYARRLVRERMETSFKSEAAEMRSELAKVIAETRIIRKEFALAFEEVLRMVGLPPDEAKQWVTDNLR
ncbi:MAG: helix-turn-helix domain-containing protein [Armatimonadota bacterium]